MPKWAHDLALYVLGLVLLGIWVTFNYGVFTGVMPVSGREVKPALPPEIIGRILGYVDAALLTFLGWAYHQIKDDKKEGP